MPISEEDHKLLTDVKCLMSAGLLQRNYPEIAISVKTRQATRAVLNSERETIGSLMLIGLLDEVESKKLKKVRLCFLLAVICIIIPF